MNDINGASFAKSLLTLLDEAYDRGSEENGVWILEAPPSAGFLKHIEALSATDAGRTFPGTDGTTIAGHAAHLAYTLNLGVRALKGENVFATADWKISWNTVITTEEEWRALTANLRTEYGRLREIVAAGMEFKNDNTLTFIMAQLAHGAWHLGYCESLMARLNDTK